MTKLENNTAVFIDLYHSGVAGNGTIMGSQEDDLGNLFYDISLYILTPQKDTAGSEKIDYDKLAEINNTVLLRNIPAFLVKEVTYDSELTNPEHVDAMEPFDEHAIQDAVVVEETPEDAILNAMKAIVIENETKNRAETDTLKVNREVDAE